MSIACALRRTAYPEHFKARSEKHIADCASDMIWCPTWRLYEMFTTVYSKQNLNFLTNIIKHPHIKRSKKQV
jgi:hypothetical protein